MRTVLEIARTDLRIIFTERGVWLNLVVIPLVVAFAVGFANGAAIPAEPPSVPTVRVDVIDHDGGMEAERFLTALRGANAALLLCPMDNDDSDRCRLSGTALDEAAAADRLRAQTSLALLIIPPGFSAAMAAGETATITYRSNEDAGAPTYIRVAVDAAAAQISGAALAGQVGANAAAALGLDDEAQTAFARAAAEQAGELWAAQPVTIGYRENAYDRDAAIARSGGGFSQSVPGMATMYVMFTVLPAAAAFMTERQQGTLQRLAVMPISRAQILGGKLLARFALGMIQYSIMLGFGLLIGARYGNDPLAVLLVMLTYTACITALTLALTTLLRNPAQASALAVLLSLTLAPLGGAWWPLEIVPTWMQTLAHISPVAWAMDAYRSLTFYGGSLVTVLPSVGVLAAAAAVLFAFGVARFRVE